MLALVTILATVIAGFFCAPWWLCGIGVALLIAESHAQHRSYKTEVLAAGGRAFMAQVRLSAGLTATVTGVAAFAIGQLLGSLIGLLEGYLRTVI
jgi:hypothetical protein